MTITNRTRSELFTPITDGRGNAKKGPGQLIRLPLTHPRDWTVIDSSVSNEQRPQPSSSARRSSHTWTNEEHERFLQGLERFPHGPWKEIANFVGTKSTRQTMTHAQKYRQKIARRQRGLEINLRDYVPINSCVSAEQLPRSPISPSICPSVPQEANPLQPTKLNHHEEATQSLSVIVNCNTANALNQDISMISSTSLPLQGDMFCQPFTSEVYAKVPTTHNTVHDAMTPLYNLSHVTNSCMYQPQFSPCDSTSFDVSWGDQSHSMYRFEPLPVYGLRW